MTHFTWLKNIWFPYCFTKFRDATRWRFVRLKKEWSLDYHVFWWMKIIFKFHLMKRLQIVLFRSTIRVATRDLTFHEGPSFRLALTPFRSARWAARGSARPCWCPWPSSSGSTPSTGSTRRGRGCSTFPRLPFRVPKAGTSWSTGSWRESRS